jgi:zinc protease
MTNDIKETRLNNGLLVLTKEMHNAPVATAWLWYRVGSRNEKPGITGISHWVEHMMFKGTPTFGKGVLDRLVARNGGQFNAFTSEDYTTYFENLPSDRIELALQIESDRMANALFDPDEVAAERTVIISEREGAENSPEFWLHEQVQAAAFNVHPYHHEVIGWKTDLETMTRDDLHAHYRTYYAPHNATLVVVGDFDTPEMLDKIARYYGPLPRGADVPRVEIKEPAQEGERRVIVKRPGPTPYFEAVYHAPDARDSDLYPLMILASVLAGVGSLTFSGGASPGRSSRLYRALVETELATNVSAGMHPTADPYLFMFTATVRPGVAIEKVEQAIFAEVDKVARKPVTAKELATVIKQFKAQFVYANDGVSNLGYWLGFLETIASYKMWDTFFENIQKVTAADVQRVAAKYLTETNRTVGWFVPVGEKEHLH